MNTRNAAIAAAALVALWFGWGALKPYVSYTLCMDDATRRPSDNGVIRAIDICDERFQQQ